MVVTDYLPLSVVEGAGFRNLLELIVPDYTVPSMSTVRYRIQKRYEDDKDSERAAQFSALCISNNRLVDINRQ